MTTRAGSIALLALATVLLTGCAGASSQPGQPGSDEPVVENRPLPTLALDCTTLIPQSVIDSAFNPETVPVDLSFYGGGGHYAVAQMGLEQAGALRCEWSDGGTATERYAQVSVLAGAAELWAKYSGEVALYQPTANSYGDASFHTCQTSGYQYCRVDVLVGDRWMNMVLSGLTSADAAGPVIEGAVAAVRDAEPVAQEWTTTATSPGCEQLAPLAGLRATLGVDVEPWERLAPTQPVIYHSGFDAAGGVFCGWRNSFSSASAMTVEVSVLPGGGWAWASYWAEEPDDLVVRQAVEGLGDDAYSGCVGDSFCFVSVLSGENWLAVSVNDESSPDETSVAAEIARVAVESMG